MKSLNPSVILRFFSLFFISLNYIWKEIVGVHKNWIAISERRWNLCVTPVLLFSSSNFLGWSFLCLAKQELFGNYGVWCCIFLALKNVNKDYLIFSYFCNFVAKSDQKPKTGWTKHYLPKDLPFLSSCVSSISTGIV